MWQAVQTSLTPEEMLAEARALIAGSLEGLHVCAARGLAGRQVCGQAAARLAAWHPYYLDRLLSGEAAMSDLDELNYILDTLFALTRRDGSAASAQLVRITLSLGRSLRLYKQIAGPL